MNVVFVYEMELNFLFQYKEQECKTDVFLLLNTSTFLHFLFPNRILDHDDITWNVQKVVFKKNKFKSLLSAQVAIKYVLYFLLVAISYIGTYFKSQWWQKVNSILAKSWKVENAKISFLKTLDTLAFCFKVTAVSFYLQAFN